MAVEGRFPDAREVRLVWHYLAFDRELRSHRTPADLDTHRSAAMRLIDRIEQASEYPPQESALCRWCEYRDICPVQKHLVKIEAISAERENTGAARGTETQPRPHPTEQLPLLFD